MEHNENRLAYQGKVEALLKQWGSQIDTWQQNVGDEAQPYITELNQKRQAVKSKLEALRSAGESQWQSAQHDLEQSVEDMQQTVERTQSQFHQT